VDKKQSLLFTEEAKGAETTEEVKSEELSEVKSFKRKKKGRTPIDPRLKREVKIIDIPEREKTCACGAKLTQIGEETSEKL
jgi:transposase